MQSAEPVNKTAAETPEPEKPVEEKKKESKRPKKKNKRDKPKDGDKKPEKAEGGDKKRERPPRVRKHVYVEEENWREKLAETVTLETKVPPKRKKEDLMKRPERGDMNKKLDKKNELIRKKRKEIDALFELKEKIRDEEMRKQNEGYNAFLVLKKDKEEAWDKLESLRKELKFQALRDKQTKWRERMRVMMDKSPFKGVAKNMAQAKAHIEKLKMDFRDQKKTAKEEKAMTESIRKYEKGLGHFEKVDALRKKLDENRQAMTAAREKLRPLEEEHKAARARLKKNSDAYKKKKEREEEEKKEKGEDAPEEKKERKKRVPSAAEEEVMVKVRKIREDIKKVRRDKDEIFDEFDKRMVEYRTDHFEFARDNYINYLVNKLKREERDRKWEENKAKEEQERLQKLKDARKEIFTAELEKVNSVNGALQLLKLDKDRAELYKAQTEEAPTGEAAPVDYEAENLELFVSKKKPKQVPVSKKRRNKKKRKEKVNLAMVVQKKTEKSLVPPDIAVILAEMGVAAPKELGEVEATIKAVAAKREEYLKLRERYVNEEQFEGAEADIVDRAERVMKSDRNWNEGEGVEGEVREQKAEKGKPKRGKKKARKVQENEDEFPSL